MYKDLKPGQTYIKGSFNLTDAAFQHLTDAGHPPPRNRFSGEGDYASVYVPNEVASQMVTLGKGSSYTPGFYGMQGEQGLPG